MSEILKTYNISKKYKTQQVLDGVSMTINEGDIYGIVGENGSGKTTIFRIVSGLIFADSGSFELFGVSNDSRKIEEVKRQTGAIIESPSIYRNFSAYENLKMQAKLCGIDDDSVIEEVLEEVGLGEYKDSKKSVGDFSLGMRQRIGIGMALIGNPKFLILDEPLNGLDPAGIVEIRNLILKLNKEKGITFLISSHILTELSLIATKYGIISKGKLIKEVTAEELIDECEKAITIDCDDTSKIIECLIMNRIDNKVKLTPTGLKIFGDADINQIIALLCDNNITIRSINCVSTSIEDYYLNLIGGLKNA